MPPDGSAASPARGTQFEHYVPQVYLRPFAATEQGRESIYRYDKISGASSLKNISTVARAKNFYEIEGVTALGETEKHLGKLETSFGPVRDRILESKDVAGLTEEERRTVSYFVATQFVRTREVREGVRDTIASIKDSLKEEKVAPGLLKEIEESESEPKIREVHLSLLDIVPRVAGLLMERKWITIMNETDMPFWTSDHPVNLRNEIDPPGTASFGIGRPEIQVFFPLSPTQSLLICDYSYYMHEPDRFVTKDVHNVVFQNDWQLRQATQFIFSNRDDFSLARRIIEGIPEIPDPERRRVGHFRLYDGRLRA